MANYIKIPLAINPPRSLVTGVGSLTASITTNSTDANNQGATNTAFTTSGTGTGATVQLTIAGNTVTVASTTVAGEGFKVGDTLTFDKSVIGGTTDVVITLVADDLIAVEGSSTNEYALFDVDTLLAVDYQFGATDAMYLWQNETRFVQGANTVTTSNLRLTFDDTPALNDGVAGQDLSEAIIKAIESPNSVPTVEWSDGLEVISIDQN